MPEESQHPTGRCMPGGATTGDVTTVVVPTRREDGSAVPPSDPATDRVQRLWSRGDDDRIAAGYRDGGEAFVSRVQVRPHLLVLDAACGSGNAALAAARAGSTVTGLDLVDAALGAASVRAAREGLSLTLDQGSVELLPYPDAAFDVVLSMFGVMFAARPDRVLAELARVTRPSGRVALASWTPNGFMGRLHAVQAAYASPPLDLPDPLHWGVTDVVRDWLDDGRWRVTTEVRTLRLRYPYTPGGTVELFRAAYGPTVRAFESLDEDRRAALAADLTALWTRHRRAAAAGTEVEAEVLEVLAHRR